MADTSNPGAGGTAMTQVVPLLAHFLGSVNWGALMPQYRPTMLSNMLTSAFQQSGLFGNKGTKKPNAPAASGAGPGWQQALNSYQQQMAQLSSYLGK